MHRLGSGNHFESSCASPWRARLGPGRAAFGDSLFNSGGKRRFAGPSYVCVGDSHRFVDAIFSFGLYVACREAGMAADAAARYLDDGRRGSADPFSDYTVRVAKGIDVLEDVLDTFWENPLAFAYLVHHKYRSPLTDVFAGRIYDDMMPDPVFDDALGSFRGLLGRERGYDDAGLYSVPIGSRYHA